MDHAQICVQSSVKPSQAPGPEGLKKKTKKTKGRGKKKPKHVCGFGPWGGHKRPSRQDGPWGPCDPYAATSPKMVLDRGRP